jgi:nitrite reductase (NADH) small subunit
MPLGMQRAIGSLAQIPKGEGRTYDVGGTKIAVFHTHAGAVFATQSSCPHRAGPLADGLIDSNTLVCPLHERIFDLHTGKGIGNDDCLTVYPAEVTADGHITLTMP